VEFYCILITRVLFYVCLRTQKQIVRSLNNLKYEPNNTDHYQTVTMTVTFCSCMICPPTSTSVNQVLRPHPVNKTRTPPPPHPKPPLPKFPRKIEASTTAWLARDLIRLLSLLCHSFNFKNVTKARISYTGRFVVFMSLGLIAVIVAKYIGQIDRQSPNHCISSPQLAS